MSKLWEWATTKVGYFCLAFFGTLGVLELINHHWWWAAMNLAAAAVVFTFWYQCPRSPGRLVREPKAPAIATDMRKGEEPVPVPGESVGTSHRLGTDPTCGICASMQERP
jgi:hypothetical protein